MAFVRSDARSAEEDSRISALKRLHRIGACGEKHGSDAPFVALAGGRGQPELASASWLRIRKVVCGAAVKHQKALIVLFVSIGAWAPLVLWLWNCAGAIPQARPWLELVNGATWPGNWEQLLREHPGRFAVMVGTRTALNFAGPLIVIGSGVWFIFVEARRIMNMSRLEQLKLLNVELVGSLISLLGRTHPDLELKPEDHQAMVDLADEVAEHWLKDAEAHDKTDEA